MTATFTPTRTRISVERFQRMGEAGIFGEDDRIELIDGELIDMAPIGIPHAFAVDELTAAFVRAAGPRVRVSTQNPVVLGEWSEPQPDLMLLRERAESYARALPRAEDILLLVEVADSTLAYDRGRKLALYARHGVAEVWIVNVPGHLLEVYRDPAPDGYRTRLTVPPGQRIAPAALPDAAIDWGASLG